MWSYATSNHRAVRVWGPQSSYETRNVSGRVLVGCSTGWPGTGRALISGDAVDTQDTPVAAVEVTLRNDSLRVARTTATNADGLYFFAEVAPAEGYVIEASAPGISFAPQRVKFEVQVGETRHILPSFIGNKVPSPTSRLQRRGSSDLAYGALPFNVRPTSTSHAWSRLLVAYHDPDVAEVAASASNASAPQQGTSSAPQQPGPTTTPPSPSSSGKPGRAKKSTSKAQSGTVESATARLDTLSASVSTVITSSNFAACRCSIEISWP